MCRTMYALCEEEARKFLDAERIPGTQVRREVDDSDYADTLPHVGSPAAG